MIKARKFILILFVIAFIGLSQPGCGNSPGQPSQEALQQVFQDELNGLDKIEKDINKGDFNTAAQVYEDIHTTFHTMILDPAEAKMGKEYGDNIHGKIGILAETIIKQDKNAALKAIQLNRDSMHTIAKDLGIKL